MKHLLLIPLFITTTALAAPVAPGLLDSDSPVFMRTGVWVSGEYPYAVGQTAIATDSGSLSFDLYERGFTMFFLYNPTGGDIQVCVETNCTVVSGLGSESLGRVEFSGLEDGLKQVVIAPLTGTLYFDAVYIYPSENTTARYGIEETFEFEGVQHTGFIEFSVTTGELVIAMLLLFIAVAQIAVYIEVMWRQRGD